MKKKNIILIVAILLLILIGVFLAYKIYYVNYYDLNHIEDFEKYKKNFVINDETLTITTTTLPEEEYFTFKNMKMRNIFEGYESKFNSDEFEQPHEEDSIWYVLKDKETEKGIAAVGFGRGPTHFDQMKSEIIAMGDFRVGEIKNMSNFFEENNITNEFELFRYLEKTKNNKNSIFDSVEDMKNFYSIHVLHFIGYTNIDGIIFIDGDYEGYIIKYNMGGVIIIECNILKDGKRYGITFNNSTYFTDDKIQDLLNTLIIE